MKDSTYPPCAECKSYVSSMCLVTVSQSVCLVCCMLMTCRPAGALLPCKAAVVNWVWNTPTSAIVFSRYLSPFPPFPAQLGWKAQEGAGWRVGVYWIQLCLKLVLNSCCDTQLGRTRQHCGAVVHHLHPSVTLHHLRNLSLKLLCQKLLERKAFS